MKTALELYPQEKNDLWNTDIYESDYQPIVDAFGNIILQESDDDYQGSTWVLYQDNDKIGFLRFGWGSCSGCDALQACRSIEEIQELMDELWQSIMWFETKAEAYKFFVEHDWEGDWDSRLEESQRFVEQAIDLIGAQEVGGAGMTGWLLFVGLASVLVGLVVGVALGIYSSALSIAKKVKKGEIIYVDKSEEQE